MYNSIEWGENPWTFEFHEVEVTSRVWLVVSAVVEYIISRINFFGILSKSCKCDNQVELFNQKTALLNKLAQLFNLAPFDVLGDRRNSVNVILPGYETLWRVVLRCFLEVRFRRCSSSHHLQHVLATFMSDPTMATFETRSELQYISAKDITLESLRLYPSTRRIYRKESDAICGGYRIHTSGSPYMGSRRFGLAINTTCWIMVFLRRKLEKKNHLK